MSPELQLVLSAVGLGLSGGAIAYWFDDLNQRKKHPITKKLTAAQRQERYGQITLHMGLGAVAAIMVTMRFTTQGKPSFDATDEFLLQFSSGFCFYSVLRGIRNVVQHYFL